MDGPLASRPTTIPDVAEALATIEAMKANMPISPKGVQAVVALAEEGARQIEQFDVRWNSDMRAIERWRAAHPQIVENLVWPDHADLVVWLMEVFDCSFEGPTVDQVAMVTARLKGAMERMPNQLTRDALELIEEMTDSMRKLARKAFLAEERVREGLGLIAEAAEEISGAASHYADHPDGMSQAYREAAILARRLEEFSASKES